MWQQTLMKSLAESMWSLETIEDTKTGDVGGWLLTRALAVDKSDNARVSYCGPGGLQYARRTVSWTIEVVDATGCGDNSLFLDADDNPHIGYFYGITEDTRCARWTGTAWSIETVDGWDGQVGRWATIELGSDGKPMMAYSDYTTDLDLKFANKM